MSLAASLPRCLGRGYEEAAGRAPPAARIDLFLHVSQPWLEGSALLFAAPLAICHFPRPLFPLPATGLARPGPAWSGRGPEP